VTSGMKPTPSKRELQILQLVANGLSSREIARELKIDWRTVDNHRWESLEGNRPGSGWPRHARGSAPMPGSHAVDLRML
jgi:hypothetical protein